MLKPYSLLLYPISFIFSFLVGISYAGWIEAGKGQMLAGGAIVLGYGVIGAFIGLCIALFVAYKAERKIILILNLVLFLLSCAMVYNFNENYKKRQAEREENSSSFRLEKTQPATFAASAGSAYNSEAMSAKLAAVNPSENSEEDMSLGMFSPSMEGLKPLYFYGNINTEKAADEHHPIDSISFSLNEHGDVSISTAPAWLVPAHLKLDYGILLFKCKSMGRYFLEIEVNTTNGQTSFVRRDSGNLSLWPDFLLGVHSVELRSESQHIKHSPFDYADDVKIEFALLTPIKIESNWMQVALRNNTFDKLGEGWVKWRSEEGLLLNYSLLC